MPAIQLIGMLDSPYVRRVAVSLQLLGLPFTHRSVSVFREFEQFRQVNPVVKAPTLVCEDGTVLMDSTLILAYAQALAAGSSSGPPRNLMPTRLPDLREALHIIGLALAVCDKSIQIIYEHNIRPPEKWHAPWLDRVGGQLQTACDALEAAMARRAGEPSSDTIDQAGVSAAVAWEFMRQMKPEIVAAGSYPALDRYGLAAERLPAFAAAPHGPGVVAARGPL